MNTRINLCLTSLCVLTLAIAMFAADPALRYPDAPRGDAVDDFRGTKVADPYHWLEDADSPQSQQWVAAENDLTAKFVAGPTNDKIKHELTDLWNYPRYTPPDHEGDEYFYTRNDGLQNQDVFYMIRKLGDAPKVLLDPNTLSTDGTVAVETQQFTNDGKFLAYGLSRSGSDRQEIHVRNVATQTDTSDLVQWTKFTSIAWLRDDSGFYYNRYPQPGTVPPDEENSHCMVYWHALGTPQEKDQMVLSRPDNIKLDISPFMTDDGAYLCVNINEGTSPNNSFYYRPTTGDPARPGDFVRLLDKSDATYSLIDNVGPIFYFQTDLDAPRGKVIAIDTRDPAPNKWKTIIPEGKDFIDSVRMVNNQLVVGLLHDAYSILRIVNLDGSAAGEIPLPTLGSIFDLTGKQTDTEMFFIFSSYAYPGGIFRYDFTTKQLQVYHKSEIKADLSDYVTEQVFATSKDGTKVPLFLTHKKGIKLDGTNPTLLYGYGGFDVNETPFFALSQLTWLEQGGVFADAVLRGGGEYGEDWHQAGMLSHKQNVFDDFIACGQWLVDNHYTSPPKLAIEGGSNGGLLVSACLLQRPDLFGAVIDQVPVTDMLRFPRFAAGVAWIPEYGDAANDADAFKYLSAYSPLQNIKPGIAYPPVLVTTADSDDRVDPSHAKKFVATLQYEQEQNNQAGMGQTNPILLRVDTKAGHGDGKPTAKYIDELADEYAFLYRVMGIDLK